MADFAGAKGVDIAALSKPPSPASQVWGPGHPCIRAGADAHLPNEDDCPAAAGTEGLISQVNPASPPSVCQSEHGIAIPSITS